MDVCPQLTALLLLATLAPATLATQSRVSSSQPMGAKAGDDVTFTCDVAGESLTFADSVQWGKVSSAGNFELIATNSVVEPTWRGLTDAEVTTSQSKLTVHVRLVDQTGTYRCQLRRGSCTPSPATTCVSPVGDVLLVVYGSVSSLGWTGLSNGSIVATVDSDTSLAFVVTATSDISTYIHVYLGMDDISNNFELKPRVEGDQYIVTGSGRYRFTRADDGANLRIDVSVPLHSKESSSATVKVLVPPQVDCPESVLVTLGDQARILCVVTSELEFTSLSWTIDGSELVIEADGGEAEGLSSTVRPQGIPSVYDVQLQVSKIEKSHLRKFKLVAENRVGLGEDDVSFHEVVPSVTNPEKILSDRQPSGAAGVLSPKVTLATCSSLVGMALSLLLLRP